MNISSSRSASGFRRFVVPVVVLLLIGSTLTSGAVNVSAQAAPAGIARQTAPATSSSSKIAAPTWSRTAEDIQAVIKENRIYYQSGSGLTAADASTGKTLWTYPKDSVVPVLLINRSLYTATKSGKIVKLNAADGKAIWSIKAPARKIQSSSEDYVLNELHAVGNVIYISDDAGVAQIDASSGKTIRNFPNLRGKLIGVYQNRMIVSTFVSGAYMRGILTAYDAKTGKMIREFDGDYYEIVGYRDHYAYAHHIPLGIDNGYGAIIDKIDLKTGRTVKRFNYLPVEYLDRSSSQKIIMFGNDFYIVQYGENSDRIQRIPLDAPSESKPESIYQASDMINDFSITGSTIAVLLNNNTTVVSDRKKGTTLASARTPSDHSVYAFSRLTIEKGKVFVQAKEKIHAVSISK
ncbi:hypothetical protein CDO73_03460 [Saccharibacillus sp. O23]|uniref:outer membrane protein assembly factor BamB family protein n=1 Tax=Saccharibacillus sp. O23 TaxID=2009338 RepID=UPI000B4E74AB|nr:PQQ-binding-like beta-propeller repeat protein [Saccharibacillus sp. O23]OWR32670.1 hypothetical protein CDO73_03460 [Saccharibacillus sp. O23]